MRTRPLALIALLAVCLCAVGGARAQSIVTPTPDPLDEIERIGPYTVSNSFEVGYRLSDVTGNRDVYRSSVNYGNGMRLLAAQVRVNTEDGKGKYFDNFSFHTMGQGQDPYQSSILRMEKHELYRYDMQFRIVNYFNRLPSLLNGERSLNSERIFQNHDLTLFPDKPVEILLGYDRNNHNGPGFSSQGIRGGQGALDSDNFIRLTQNLRQINNQYRGGVNVRVAGVALTFMQAFDNYREDTEFGNGFGLPGSAANIQPIDVIRRDEPTHGNTPITSVAIRTENEHMLGFHGRFVWAGGERNFVLSEDLAATDPAKSITSLRQTLILGEADRKQGAGDFTAVFMPTEKWTITNTTSVNNTRIRGDGDFLEITTFENRFLEFEMLDIRHISNLTEVNFSPVRKLGLYGAYRHTERRVRSDARFHFPDFDFQAGLEERENKIRSGLGGFRWRPVKGLRISFDAEVGDADLPFTPISEKDFHNETARVQWRKNGLMLGASFKNSENENSLSLINHSSEARQIGLQGSWMRTDGKVSLDASYTKTDLDTASGIFNFFEAADALDQQAFSLYTSNLHTFYFGGQFQPQERLTFSLGYTVSKDTGDGRALSFAEGVVPNYPVFGFDGVNFYSSFPLTYQSPLARVSLRINKSLAWNVGWQYYSYDERFTSDQNYHAHVGYSSFRWTF